MRHNVCKMGGKQFYLDNACQEILKQLPAKKQSEYVRDAIKFYNYNKDREFIKASAIPQKVTILET